MAKLTEELTEEPKVVDEIPAEVPPGEDAPAQETAPVGYLICTKVMPGRMTVCRKPLEPETVPAEGEEPGAEYEEIEVDTIEQALKASLRLYRENPVDDSEDAHLAAGYGDKPGASVAGEY